MGMLFASPVTALIVLLIVIGLMAKFFRTILVKLIIALVVEILLFALFPSILIFFVHLITRIRTVL